MLRILAPQPLLVWAGAVWGLETSAFVHLAWWHRLRCHGTFQMTGQTSEKGRVGIGDEP
jgi:hypothetical protein